MEKKDFKLYFCHDMKKYIYIYKNGWIIRLFRRSINNILCFLNSFSILKKEGKFANEKN